MTREDQVIVEDITDGLAAHSNMENWSTYKKHCFLQGALYIYEKY